MNKVRTSPRILVVEGSDALRQDLYEALIRAGLNVQAEPRVPDFGEDSGGSRFDLALLSAEALKGRGAESISRMNGPMILLGFDASIDPDLWARLRAEAVDWLQKPFSIDVLERRVMRQLEGRGDRGWPTLDPWLKTENSDWQATLVRAEKWARRSIPMSLIGELGSGRIALAHQIHLWSERAQGPFIVIETSEFEARGRAKVLKQIQDIRHRAQGGTLVWRDPESSSAEVQKLILAMLRSSKPGDAVWMPVAEESLEESVALGCLDRELQYRLEVALIRVPPLRERPEDQFEIVRAVLRRVARELGVLEPPIDETLVKALARGGFSGNRLGLEARFRAALIRSEGCVQGFSEWIERESGSGSAEPMSAGLADSLNLKTLERETIVRALSHWKGNRTRASESLGISVRTLRNKIREYSLH